ncbi:MAG: hypothetical protein V4682_02745 [Patescibacteria group bacterium]
MNTSPSQPIWKRKYIWISFAVLVILGGTAYFLTSASTMAPASVFPLAQSDSSVEWEIGPVSNSQNHEGTYITTEIASLEELVQAPEDQRPAMLVLQGSLVCPLYDEYSDCYGTSDYDLYMAIAERYLSIGKGEEAYRYLEKAIANNPSSSLAYMRLGNVAGRLGAYATANAAHKKAVEVEPELPTPHIAYVALLTNISSGDTYKNYPDLPGLLLDIEEEEKKLAVVKEKYPDDEKLSRALTMISHLRAAYSELLK